MFADVVLEKSNQLDCNIRIQLEKIMQQLKQARNITGDEQISTNDYEKLCFTFKKHIQKTLNQEFPEDSYSQLWKSIDAVFKSWNGKRAKEYRKIEKIEKWKSCDGWRGEIQVCFSNRTLPRSGK